MAGEGDLDGLAGLGQGRAARCVEGVGVQDGLARPAPYPHRRAQKAHVLDGDGQRRLVNALEGEKRQRRPQNSTRFAM